MQYIPSDNRGDFLVNLKQKISLIPYLHQAPVLSSLHAKAYDFIAKDQSPSLLFKAPSTDPSPRLRNSEISQGSSSPKSSILISSKQDRSSKKNLTEIKAVCSVESIESPQQLNGSPPKILNRINKQYAQEKSKALRKFCQILDSAKNESPSPLKILPHRSKLDQISPLFNLECYEIKDSTAEIKREYNEKLDQNIHKISQQNFSSDSDKKLGLKPNQKACKSHFLPYIGGLKARTTPIHKKEDLKKEICASFKKLQNICLSHRGLTLVQEKPMSYQSITALSKSNVETTRNQKPILSFEVIPKGVPESQVLTIIENHDDYTNSKENNEGMRMKSPRASFKELKTKEKVLRLRL